jgi:hypothetical protein
VVRHELPKEEQFCAHDGHALVEIGVQTSEQLDVIPASRCASSSTSGSSTLAHVATWGLR